MSDSHAGGVFNCFYTEYFDDLGSAIVPNDHGFSCVEGNRRGLKVMNRSAREGFISANLAQVFDFTVGYSVSGYFALSYTDPNTPCALGFAFCDEAHSRRICVILGDGNPHNFTVKLKGEDVGDEDVRQRSPKVSVHRSDPDGVVFNHFKIIVSPDQDNVAIAVYVSQNGEDFGPDSLVHHRVVDSNCFFGRGTSIKIISWKAGIIELYKLTVAELGS